ncbi:hypothetical protein [Actinoplanes sp. RD1]|uniref:hypothetical protein n=1 Tax=Actinoplanes sp. RD1 TaxID=3064538 RepID=UPI00274221B9|nr:hypothetical protein [Actinoplanes sp. RD1]
MGRSSIALYVIMVTVPAVVALLWRLGPARRRAAGVERRLAWVLSASGLAVTPVAHGHGAVRAADGTWRYSRSLLLRDVPLAWPELSAAQEAFWTRAGLRVRRGEAAPGLEAFDTQGYVLRLAPAPGFFGDAILEAASPPLATLGFLGGVGAVAAPAALSVAALYLTDSDGTATALLAGLRAGVAAGLASGLLCLLNRAHRATGRGLVAAALPVLAVLLVFT